MTLISIDWDFLVYNGESERLIELPNGDTIPGIFLYDWGHSEAQPIFGDRIWSIRAANFRAHYGLDIYEEVSIRTDLGSPSIEGFAGEIRKRFDVFRWPFLYADSHANGIIAVERRSLERFSGKNPGSLNVVSFDAHHDLGYGDSSTKLVQDQHRVDAGSWLYGALYLSLVDHVQIVYPDWRGLWEWGDEHRPWLEEDIEAGRIEILTWSEWLARTRPKDPLEQASLFACRSSAWTPPWMDAAFAELISSFPTKGSECLDHGSEKVGAFDGCVQREWDREEAEQMAEFFAKSLAELKDR